MPFFYDKLCDYKMIIQNKTHTLVKACVPNVSRKYLEILRLKTTIYFGYIPYSNLVNFNEKYFKIRRIQTPTCITFSKDPSKAS